MSVPDVPTPEPVPYRFRVGGVGHRNLANPEAVRAAVDRLIDQLTSTLASVEAAPPQWTVITPAAKGADRIIAESVLERHETATFDLISPFAVDEYRKDFDTPDDLAEFDMLADRADRIVELNHDAAPTDIDDRRLGYLDAGRTVVEMCEVLIAVWDGHPARGVGGSADTIAYAASLGRLVLVIDAADPDQPPRRVVAQSVRDDAASDPARPLDASQRVQTVGEPVPTEPQQISPGFMAQAAFLDASRPSDPSYAAEYRAMAAKIHADAEVAGLDAESTKALATQLLPNQARASSAATRHQQLHAGASIAVFLFSAAAVTVAVFQGMFHPDVWALTVIELVFVALAVGAFALNRRCRWHDRWLHERYLAEQLRVSIYTILLDDDGPEPPPHASDRLPFYAGPQGWLPATMRAIVRRFAMPEPGPDAAATRAFALHGWLRDQAAWHYANARSKRRIATQLRFAAIGALSATVVLGLAVIVLSIADAGPTLTQTLSFASIVLPVWATAAHGISKLLEYDRVAARSTQMAQLMGLYHDRAAVAGDGPAFDRIIREAAETAALEHYEWWVVLSFDRPDLV